mmetsp:Transcript_24800/g.76593  ORF Transcript_24800/g.76593 Transcript_24800/m.76593 type:complete len:273 (-) Transcript_24800:156-974(-)
MRDGPSPKKTDEDGGTTRRRKKQAKYRRRREERRDLVVLLLREQDADSGVLALEEGFPVVEDFVFFFGEVGEVAVVLGGVDVGGVEGHLGEGPGGVLSAEAEVGSVGTVVVGAAVRDVVHVAADADQQGRVEPAGRRHAVGDAFREKRSSESEVGRRARQVADHRVRVHVLKGRVPLIQGVDFRRRKVVDRAVQVGLVERHLREGAARVASGEHFVVAFRAVHPGIRRHVEHRALQCDVDLLFSSVEVPELRRRKVPRRLRLLFFFLCVAAG